MSTGSQLFVCFVGDVPEPHITNTCIHDITALQFKSDCQDNILSL